MAFGTAIMTKFTALIDGAHNDFYTDIQGRMARGHTEETDYPRASFFPVYENPEYPGGKTIEEGLWQFDLFSASRGYGEIENMLTHLQALYDDCTLTITGATLIYFIRGQFQEIFDEVTVTTEEGTVGVKHYVQEYMVSRVKT